jgi:uncharacterized membrane protein
MFDFSHLHSMIVHFPIALLLVAFLSDLAGIIFKRDFFTKAGLFMMLLGTGGLVAAYLSGDFASEGLTEAGPLKMAIERHEDAAAITLWIMIATVVVRLGLVAFRRYAGALRWIPLALFLVGVLSVARTGYYGGELVFKHAAGVQFSLGTFGGENQIQAPETEEED